METGNRKPENRVKRHRYQETLKTIVKDQVVSVVKVPVNKWVPLTNL